MRMPRSLALGLLLLLGAASRLAAQGDRVPEVSETVLPNGAKVLLVERPGGGSVHVRIFLKGGRADTGRLAPGAADLVARTLFGRLGAEGEGPRLESLVRQEEGAFESLRLDRLRQARSALGEGGGERSALEALHRKAMEALREQLEPAARRDALDALGATRREVTVASDHMAFGVDLPSAHLEAFCRLEASVLRRLPLEAFPLERERLVREQGQGMATGEGALSVLLATALAGQPYARVAELSPGGLEAVAWGDLKDFARWLADPSRLIVVLAGEVRRPEAMAILERTLGTLGRGQEEADRREAAPTEDGEAPGARRLQAAMACAPRLYMGWRIPPAVHPDIPALQVLARILGGGPGSRLQGALREGRGVARRLEVKVGVPGGRDGSLLLLEAEPLETRSLDELEQVVQGEVLRLQREPIQDGEIRRAQAELEAAQLLVQEDAGALALALGEAACQGDWRLAFRALSMGRTHTQAELQDVARRLLVPARATTVLLGPDPLLQPADRMEARLVKILTTLVQARLSDPVESETVVRETVKQLRLLSPREREQTLKLLEAQVAP